MYRQYAMVRELAKTNPLPLLDLKDNKLIQYANSLLPYSVGMEFECSPLSTTDFSHYLSDPKEMIKIKDGFKKVSDLIPFLRAINNDCAEQRFRIPSGIKGLVCLWYISLFLKKYFGLNPLSGIHYHIDMSENKLKGFWNVMYRNPYVPSVHNYYREDFIMKNNDWIIEALKHWNYRGTYNQNVIAYNSKQAVKFHSNNETMEVRVGEMTFDYELLYKRISNCCNIAKRLKRIILAPKMTPKVEKGSKLTKAEALRNLYSDIDVF